MTIAARVLAPIVTTEDHRRRKHQAKSNRVGQIAKPCPQLNEATNPAQIIIGSIGHKRDAFGIKRRASVTPAIVKEFWELNPPDRVMAYRPIQKLPTITTSMATILAVKPTVSSRQTVTNSSAAVIKSSASPAKTSGCWLP